ncbi:uncharacterized protein [Cicer arietinum]|uniref:Uncharacterized WD repeat-containing protein C17D11.16-like n=1 Tax=Cicer arietinum TaxID=3827 RepID=A0A1S2YNK5_CICAR|nr:uncharacterized WD repeat-containing protein C17D11.16-like [Cicer arietinum]
MISALSWIPKGVFVVDPPSPSEKDIEESIPLHSKESDNEDNKNDDDELEDTIIYPTDSVSVTAYINFEREDHGLVMVWMFDDRDMNWFVHDYIELKASPLSMALLDCPIQGGERGNFLAVGTMKPSIEIWNLDRIEEVAPCLVLGCTDGHTDSICGLASNKENRNIIASAGADSLVKIWDVVAEKCDITMGHHSNMVGAVAWNHHAPQLLLSGSFDHTLVLKDVRTPSHSGYRWSVTDDVETIEWDPHAEHSFVAGLGDGSVKCFDIRTATAESTSELSSTFTLHAHDRSVTSVSYNLSAPNLLATASYDQTVKLWDLSNNQPSCVASKNPGVGSIFCISFSKDNPFMLAIGGRMVQFHAWDSLSDPGVFGRYGN